MNNNQENQIIGILQERFLKNMHRHEGIEWQAILERLNNNDNIVKSLIEMESTGGEPDIIGMDNQSGKYIFCDCSIESPKGRRSLCYDRQALDSRKENKPKNSVIDVAAAMGIQLLTETQYRELQKIEQFDLKTSSWVKTRTIYENLAAPFIVTGVTIRSSPITMVLNRIMPQGDFAVV